MPTTQAELDLELPNVNLPTIGGSSGHYISAVKEGEKGLRILRLLRASGELIEDPEINLWIRSLGNKLAIRAPSVSTPFYFAVSKNSSVNAFATIGGVIVVNAGLILRSDSESELAAVMSHEIAHVTQRHLQRILAKAQKNKFATGAALVVGALAATQDANAGAAIINTTLAASAHKQLSYSREAEAEADRVGLRILANAGFNPLAMPSFLQKLEQFDNSKTADIREFLQHHPLSIKRVSDTTLRAQQLGTFKGSDNVSYLYMREKVRTIISNNLVPPLDSSERIKKYAKILSLDKRSANTQALNIAQSYQYTKNQSEALLLSQLFNKQQHYQKTIALLRPFIQLYPGNEAITANLAQALLLSGQYQQAWKYLEDLNISEQTSLQIFEIKQEAARILRNNSHAYRAVAERSIRTGRYKSADLQLRQAIRLPGSKISELQEMQQLLV